MNFYKIFYLFTVADRLSTLFGWLAFFFTCGFLMFFFCHFFVTKWYPHYDDPDGDKNIRTIKNVKRAFYANLILGLISWTIWVSIPSKKECVLIIAGGAVGNFITTDSSAKQLPSDVLMFLRTEIQKETKEAELYLKKEIGVKTRKDSLMEMTKEQLVEQLDLKDK